MALFGKNRGTNRLFGTENRAAGEIDLRTEFSEVLRGSIRMPQRGHWVILRRFDLTKHSENFDEVMNEGVGGAAFEFTDELLLVRRRNRSLNESGEFETALGELKAGEFIYYFEHTVKITKVDQILEIDWPDMTIKPRLHQIPKPYREKLNIKEVNPRRLDSGRIEYFDVHAIIDQVNY